MDPITRETEPELVDTNIERLEEIDDDDEPTTEELIEMFRQALEDVKAGRTRPASEVLRELREMLADDDDAC
ncbi:MAG: hypothetical protein OXE46_11110 [Chloroflexi bacterium]|nr:hypothetical protein [Chloroflexota bacterium]